MSQEDLKHTAVAGQAVYTPWVLNIYDLWVLGISNHLIWRCPTKKLRALYDRNVSLNHLDIGVGTGYYLKNVNWPSGIPKVTLFDLNENSLQAAARRIAHLQPSTVHGDVLKPFPELGKFRSVGLCYLLHCLPGSLRENACVFDHVQPVLMPGGRIFGATLVQGETPRSWPAQKLMDAYNRRGIFSNEHDNIDVLTRELNSRFSNVRVETIGCVALFEAENSLPE